MLKTRSNGEPMGEGKILAANPPVIGNVGGHSGDNSGHPLGFFGIQVALVVGRFSVFNLLQDIIYRCQPQGLIPKSCVNDGFNFGGAFAAPGEARNEISHFCHSSGRVGWRKQTVSCCSYRRRADSERKSAETTSLRLGQTFKYYLVTQPLRAMGAPLFKFFNLILNSLRS
jgi:hypothetical protein